MSCIRALDWMPGCGWPLWAQYVVGVVGAFITLYAWHSWKNRRA